MVIKSAKASPIFDSKGFLTVEITVELDDGTIVYGAAPRGSTKGSFEANVYEDFRGDFISPGVNTAINQFNKYVAPVIKGLPVNFETIDKTLIDLRNTYNVSSDSIVAASYAILKANAYVEKTSCCDLLGQTNFETKPVFNIIDGLKAHFSNLKGIEILLIPKEKTSYFEMVLRASDIFHILQFDLWEAGYRCDTGPQGALTPDFKTLENALEFLCYSLLKTNKSVFNDFTLGLDMAMSDLFKQNKYSCKFLNGKSEIKEKNDLFEYYENITNKFPITYIEDGFSDIDYSGWEKLMHMNPKIDVVGDDITASNSERISLCIDKNLINSVVIKPNQVGTISESVKSLQFAKKHNLNTIVSQRTSETEDNIISHLALGCNADMIKVGAPNRMDRISKSNEMIRLSRSI